MNTGMLTKFSGICYHQPQDFSPIITDDHLHRGIHQPWTCRCGNTIQGVVTMVISILYGPAVIHRSRRKTSGDVKTVFTDSDPQTKQQTADRANQSTLKKIKR